MNTVWPEVFRFVVCAGICLAAVSRAHGDLQNAEVGGRIVILGEYYRNVETAGDGSLWPASWLIGRPVGNGPGIFSGFGWDSDGPALSLVSQWTRLHLNADFTERVRAFIELDSVEVWGEDFRSEAVTGGDSRASTMDDVEIYQAYIEAREAFGTPLRFCIGRQELSLGSGWLAGVNDDGPAPAWGLSFDAIRVTYEEDCFALDLWSAKLAERSPMENGGDTDFRGVYTQYRGVPDIVFDAYWMWLRDASAIERLDAGTPGEWLENVLGVDAFGATNLHTLGLRTAGRFGAFEFDAEAAYQFGQAGQIGALFRPVLYGDTEAEFGAWGCHLQLGYQFDTPWQPYIQAVYAFLQGEDRRDVTFGQWLGALFNPFHRGRASVSFNRLFSNYSYSAILDGTDLSNARIFHLAARVTPIERVELAVDLGYYLADAAFQQPLVPLLSFWSESNDRALGWELDANITYRYSEDLEFCAGWDHLFTGKGLAEGSFTQSNGLDFNGGPAGEDADYFYFETGITF